MNNQQSVVKPTSRWQLLKNILSRLEKSMPSEPNFSSEEYIRWRRSVGSIIQNNDCSDGIIRQFDSVNPYIDFESHRNNIEGIKEWAFHLSSPIEIPPEYILSPEKRETWVEDNKLLFRLIADEFDSQEEYNESFNLPPEGKEIPNQKQSIPLSTPFLYLQFAGAPSRIGLWFKTNSKQVGYKTIRFSPQQVRIVRYLHDIRFNDIFALTREEIGEKIDMKGKSVGSRINEIVEKCQNTGMPTKLIEKGATPSTWMLDQKLDCCSLFQRQIVTEKWKFQKRKRVDGA